MNGDANGNGAAGTPGGGNGAVGEDGTMMVKRPMPRMPRGDINSHIYGKDAAQGLFLPWFRRWKVPHEDYVNSPPIDPQWLFHSCGFKVITGGIMGSVMGIAMGLFLGAMGGDTQLLELVKGKEIPQAPLREQMRAALKATRGKARGWAKSFGLLTAGFEGVECCLEKYRGKHDIWNQAISGCVVGGAISSSGGPAAACMGCAGFAGFSVLIDKIMGPH